MQKNLQFEQSMLKEREQRVRQIEEDVLDVNQIMRELNTLINQQGETVGMYRHHLWPNYVVVFNVFILNFRRYH